MTPDRLDPMAANGPPPDAAGVLYPGEVMHQRLKPFGHRFTYNVFSLLVDIDRLPEMAQATRLLSVDAPGFASFHQADHVAKPGQTLRQHVDALLSEAGLERPARRVLLLAYPRILGYVFNPLSVYFAYDESDRLVALIYAVRNTFGQRHTYVAPLREGEAGPAGISQTRTKIFHVSPFIPMGARYRFRILPPGRRVRLYIHETEAGEGLLTATFDGTAKPLTGRNLAGLLARFPLMTFKIIAAIHWQALRLWLKGARFHPEPPLPPPASFRDEGEADPR
ncbi:DUF1365 domain-containing protein [Pseudochelatococcus contaminans]|uniref:DUF1365 domain-containing protein n=1 Tax=Pseudochelatococcus contaminans TaxID=1538103 RepID=A0A7W5Z5U9_9HYPH|nr:DUF1365 domain-containing protein [Pseudochelatococcus contaminans]MBB3810687.1 hypothetical protein [Pseudochelatococcus contaminans]